MNKDAEGRWKVGRSYIKLKMRAIDPLPQPTSELPCSAIGIANLLASQQPFGSIAVQLYARIPRGVLSRRSLPEKGNTTPWSRLVTR